MSTVVHELSVSVAGLWLPVAALQAP